MKEAFWIIVLVACPPHGGSCDKVHEYPGRWPLEARPYCQLEALRLRWESQEGERWMTAPGWFPDFFCVRPDKTAPK